MGLWPSDIDDRLFYFFFGFLTIHCCLEYAELFQYINDFESVISNLTESTTLTMALVKLGVCRLHAKRLCRVLDDIIDDYKDDRYKTQEERLVFLKYNEMVKSFIKFAIPSMCFAATMFYFKPLTGLMTSQSVKGNSSRLYVLPYRTRIFFEITESHTYVSIYAIEGLIVPLITCGYTGADCFLVTLVLHVCGQFSILALQVKNFAMDPHGYRHGIHQLTVNHLRLIRITKNINQAFSWMLLPQLLIAPVILCLSGCNLLNSSGGLEQRFNFLIFVMHSLCMTFVLFTYCYIGECLIKESTNFGDALYNSEWYDIPWEHAKLLVICIRQTQKPMELTAGRFYILSLQKFTYIIKTSMAYLSMLRTFL
uniref:Odorant receptor n=1 Tax=Sirex nitobei TaxID=1602346 RepID=A0A857N3E5_9HYME|nr:odorant receptor 21b [Sirex nitobei]